MEKVSPKSRSAGHFQDLTTHAVNDSVASEENSLPRFSLQAMVIFPAVTNWILDSAGVSETSKNGSHGLLELKRLRVSKSPA